MNDLNLTTSFSLANWTKNATLQSFIPMGFAHMSELNCYYHQFAGAPPYQPKNEHLLASIKSKMKVLKKIKKRMGLG